jgi:hypothetical protein
LRIMGLNMPSKVALEGLCYAASAEILEVREGVYWSGGGVRGCKGVLRWLPRDEMSWYGVIVNDSILWVSSFGSCIFMIYG